MKALIGVAVVLLGGCATAPPPLHVTYESDPPGATLYQNGQPLGTTPRTLQYSTDQAFRNGGCKQLSGTEVKWASGVTASLPSLNACSSGGYRQKFVYVRPDAPGREIDANYALQLQRNQIMQNANAIQQMNASKASSPVKCISQQVGNTIQTRCQ